MMDILTDIQVNLKAPKNQFNSFGKYNYRNCEDILEALKPLLEKHNAHITLTDSIEIVGNRYYINALVTLYQGKTIIGQTSALARESEDKKGMDASQITGAASSYARKYALNGLFAIDDTKDADSANKPEPGKKPDRETPPPEKETPPVKPSQPQIKKFYAMAKAKGLTKDETEEFREWLKLHPDIDTVDSGDGKLSITKKGLSFLFDKDGLEFNTMFRGWQRDFSEDPFAEQNEEIENPFE